MSRLWYTRCPAPTPFGIAVQKGWLEEEFAADGIDVQALQDADDVKIRRSHFTHTHPGRSARAAIFPRSGQALTAAIHA